MSLNLNSDNVHLPDIFPVCICSTSNLTWKRLVESLLIKSPSPSIFIVLSHSMSVDVL